MGETGYSVYTRTAGERWSQVADWSGVEWSGAATGESGSKHSAAGGQASTNQPSASSSATAVLLHLDIQNISPWLPSCFVHVGCSCKDLVSVFQGKRQNHKTAEGRISDDIIVDQA